MTDYRQQLYRKYVSQFKRAAGALQCTSEKESWRYFDHKYFRYIRGLAPDDAILEVGCGSGVLLAYLAQKGFRNAEGVDISEEQIEIARARNLRIQCGDVFAFLESKVEAYKAVIAIDFIEHFTKEEALNLLPLFFRSLKKDGILLLQTPNGQGLFAAQIIYGDLTHCTIFTPESLRQVLRLAGFDHILFDETGPVQKDLKGTLRLVLWKIIKAGANFARLVEAGKQQNIWTENLICVSRRPSTSNGG